MVYDSRDRLVLSQDGEERADSPNRWSYSQYDAQGRVVETGELVLSQAQSHEELQRAASKSENYLPSGTRTALQYTAYDSYPSGCTPFQATAGYSESYNAYPIGQITSVKSRRLATDEWETVTTYYDDYARPIQAITAKGQTKTSCVDMEYDFLGNVVKLRETQSDGMSLETVNTYDSRSRLLSSVTTKNKTEQAVMKYGYDAVGRLVEKRYGNTVEKLGYNVRGWLTSKESAAFKMQLRYEQPEGGATACYNGNICEWEWSHGTNPILMYSFAYDSFGRLASANQQQASGNGWAELAANYVEKGITYDRNGNIRTLQRTAGNPVDDLIYGYRGNQLVSLSEQVRTSQSGDVYLPGNTASGMYEYDSNGNLTKDIRKGLEYKYNRLNLLEEVWKDGEMKAQYNYLADGTKLGVRDGSGKTGYDYVGSVVYKVVDGRREFDRAVVGDMHFTNEGVRYALTDQLGSVRALIDEDGNVVQQNDYYPFGAKIVRDDYADSDDNRSLFSGKESQELLDLNAYDFGARMYDASLGRWNMVDPLGEKYVNLSPYNYCANSPQLFNDPNGTVLMLRGNIGEIIMALYNGLDEGTSLELKFHNGILDPYSIEWEAMRNSNLFLQDLYEIVMSDKIVELSFSKQNKYLFDGKFTMIDFEEPYDYDSRQDLWEIHWAKVRGESYGKRISGNLGQTLMPNARTDSKKSSTNENVQIIINSKGNINHRTMELAHEFGHVILYLRGLPYSHQQLNVDKFINIRIKEMSERLGYEY